MDSLTVKLAMALFIVFGVCAACSTDGPAHGVPAITRDSSPSQKAIEQQALSSQPARLVDFANFTFPWPSDLGDSKKALTLRSGQLEPTRDERGMVDEMGVSLESIAYGDVTGDKIEEAIVVLSIITGGSAIPHAVYLYRLQDGNPKLLWAFSTGDRADGGLRQVYAENGEIVIERYSPVGSKGDCCPISFARARYEWNGSRFEKKGKEETLPNPAEHGSPIMPRYSSSG